MRRPLPLWTYPVIMIGSFWVGALIQGKIDPLGVWLVPTVAVVSAMVIWILRWWFKHEPRR